MTYHVLTLTKSHGSSKGSKKAMAWGHDRGHNNTGYRDALASAGTNALSERPRVLAARTRPINVDWARCRVRIAQAVECSEEGVHDGRGDGEQQVAAGIRVLGTAETTNVSWSGAWARSGTSRRLKASPRPNVSRQRHYSSRHVSPSARPPLLEGTHSLPYTVSAAFAHALDASRISESRPTTFLARTSPLATSRSRSRP